jgi:hypothetical protein
VDRLTRFPKHRIPLSSFTVKSLIQMIDAYLRRVPSPLLGKNRTQPRRMSRLPSEDRDWTPPHASESSKDRKCCKTGEKPIKQASRRIPAQSP